MDEYKNMAKTDPNYTEFKGYCDAYSSDAFSGKIMGYGVTVAILVVNIILRLVLINLVKWIGEDTHSQQLKTITNYIFIT